MALRGRTRIASDDFDRASDSSPDPLALSLNEATTKSPRKKTPRKALTPTSPSKQIRGSSVSEFEFSSPSKAMVMNTPRMGSASPWRIKVTVQAEPGSDENEHSPSVKRVTRTQTTTVPLKDEDAPAPIKRGRGRPRKSDVRATPKPKRAGTPIKRAARASSQDVAAAGAESSAADVDTDAPPKRRRGRPRKSVQPAQDEDTMMILDSHGVVSIPLRKPRASATKPTSQKSTRFASPQSSGPTIAADMRRMNIMEDYEMPLVDTPPQTELAKQLRARKGTPHAKKVVQVTPSDAESDLDSGMLTPTSGDDHIEQDDAPPEAQSTVGSEAQSAADNFVTQQVPTFSVQSPADEEGDLQDVTRFAFDEGTTRMPDDTTIIDSENFSMISVASLPSSSGLTNTPQTAEATAAVPEVDSIAQHIFLKPFVKPSEPAQRPILRRYKTPVVDAANPAAPPVVQPVQAKPETPQLGRVVTAGVALQGLLDPSRLTPEPSQKALDEKRDRLDDLFRGFSEGTRKDLQAGLRLGEQLAQDQPKEHTSPARASPFKVQDERATETNEDPRSHQKPRQSRLLTPEDQDAEATPGAESVPQDVQYPSLDVAATEKSLPSPARSEEVEMSWRVDTPPPAATGNTERMRFMGIMNQTSEGQDYISEHTTAGASEPAKQEDYSDIWQEEASRASNSAESEEVPKVQDLFEPGPAVPARGKLPRTWRRESGNHFQYSDEAASPPQSMPPSAEIAQDSPEASAENDAHEEAEEDEDVASDASDDTGMFFQSNMPSIFSNRHSRDLKQRKAAKLDLTLLVNEGESMAPESSPPAAAKKSSPLTKSNPFLNTPPRFKGIPSSPSKSSPLRQELRGSDISSESHSRIHEESSLPIAQSSPFHTLVDGESKMSVASDERQLFMEMEGVTDSSIRLVRNEVNQYLDAYEPQERSLDEIEEVTEPSRTWHKNTTIVASSPPPQMALLSPIRKRVPLFQHSSEKPKYALHKPVETSDNKVFDANKDSHQQPDAAIDAPPPQHQQPSTGLLSRMTSSLWSAVTQPPAVPTAPPSPSTMPPHPLINKLPALPRIEPWTKTHYKTLDRLWAVQKSNPRAYNPNPPKRTTLSRINTHLLRKFLATVDKPFLGATFRAWGYEFDMNESMIVLCQVFIELMSLESIVAYEKRTGREIEMGDCMPGPTGVKIDGMEVARRLATVILGEHVRNDEKAGLEIDRSGSLELDWPKEER